MTDNYKEIYKYMFNLGIANTRAEGTLSDLFFDVQLIRRGKDHPNLPAANYTFKAYYFDSLEGFEKAYQEIKTCCDIFELRAYVSVNAKSKTEASKKTCERYAHDSVTNDFRKPWKDFSSVCGGLDGAEKRWVVDVDECENETDTCEYADKVVDLIRLCDTGYPDPVVTSIPTKSGYHIITHPFNLKQFNDFCEKNCIIVPDVKKNHITLLYENLNYAN